MSIILIYAKLQVSLWHILAALCMTYRPIYRYNFSVNFTSLRRAISVCSPLFRGRWTSSIGLRSIRGVLKYIHYVENTCQL